MQNLVLVNVGTSTDFKVQYQLNHFKYKICACIARNVSKLFLVIISYYFNFLNISEQIPKVPPFLKLGCK